MKKIILMALVSATGAYSATPTTPTTTGEIKAKSSVSAFKDFGLTLEMANETVNDSNSEAVGTWTGLAIEPSYNITKKVMVSTIAQYDLRQASGDELGEAEKANRDHLSSLGAKLLYKAASYKTNDIADVRLQARVYSDQDDFFKRRYAADGNYQLRAYFGRPIAGNWKINKYTTYLRYKNYFNNSNVSDFSRDYELRARVNPTYSPIKGVELGPTFTYNHMFGVNKNFDEENIEIDLSARYQYEKYAALFSVKSQYMNNNGGSTSLTQNPDANEDLIYSLVLTAYL